MILCLLISLVQIVTRMVVLHLFSAFGLIPIFMEIYHMMHCRFMNICIYIVQYTAHSFRTLLFSCVPNQIPLCHTDSSWSFCTFKLYSDYFVLNIFFTIYCSSTCSIQLGYAKNDPTCFPIEILYVIIIKYLTTSIFGERVLTIKFSLML